MARHFSRLMTQDDPGLMSMVGYVESLAVGNSQGIAREASFFWGEVDDLTFHDVLALFRLFD